MKKIIALIIILVLVVGFSFYFFKKPLKITGNLPINTILGEKNKESVGGVGWQIKSGVLENSIYGFSVRVPDGLKVTSLNDGDGDTYLMQGGLVDVKNYSFQIHVREFGDNIDISISRIKKDVPDLKMIDPIEIKTDGVPTVAFYSVDGDTKYREIWVVHNGYLYQFLSNASYDNVTGQIMETWKWKG